MSAVAGSSGATLGGTLIRRRAPALLVALISSGLLLFGGRLLLAGIADYQAEAFLTAWETVGAEPDERAWTIAHDAAQRAIDLYPVTDGERLDRLGRIYSWKEFRQPFAAPSAQASRQTALDAYRASVSARPTWPDSWARLAHSKLYLQQFDDEFANALNQAFALGPWRIAVNRELAQIGLMAWPRLSPEQQQATLESARRVAAFGPNEAQQLLNLAEQTGTLQQVCAVLDSDKPPVECQN